MASSNLQTANVFTRAVAKMAATYKASKYRELAAQSIFQPVALETHQPIDSNTSDFLVDLGQSLKRLQRRLRYFFSVPVHCCSPFSSQFGFVTRLF